MIETLPLISFYFFGAITVLAAVAVISVKNPVHAALCLVLTFFSTACTWLLADAEFLAIALVLVYVGAVMVLFLFVVMMLDINVVKLKEGFLDYLPIGAMIGAALLAEILFGLGVLGGTSSTVSTFSKAGAQALAIDNTRAIGRVLYTQYFYVFQVAGLVLLVAMIGAIVLTLRRRPGVRRQRVSDQLYRPKEESVTLVKVPSRGGV